MWYAYYVIYIVYKVYDSGYQYLLILLKISSNSKTIYLWIFGNLDHFSGKRYSFLSFIMILLQLYSLFVCRYHTLEFRGDDDGYLTEIPTFQLLSLSIQNNFKFPIKNQNVKGTLYLWICCGYFYKNSTQKLTIPLCLHYNTQLNTKMLFRKNMIL